MTSTAREISRRVTRSRFRPPPRLTVSQWADRFRVLSPEASFRQGPFSTDDAPYQREPMDAMGDGTVRGVVLRWASQLGKALAVDTPLPTPDGWTTMGDARVGDILFDEQGRQCRVTFATEVMYDRPCYRVAFSDGSSIIADEDHRWFTHAYSEGSKGPRPERRFTPGAGVRTTAEIRDTISARSGGFNHRVDVAHPLQIEPVGLPIPPYTLGVWLGDGNSHAANVTAHEDDLAIFDGVHNEGITTTMRRRDSRNPAVCAITLDARGAAPKTMFSRLRDAGLLKNKHVPACYLRGSEAQRLALFQGLMDTDGYCGPTGSAEFTSTLRCLADAVVELARSLGLKPRLAVGRSTISGRDCGEKYRVTFTAYRDTPVFRLHRKLQWQRDRNDMRSRPTEASRRSIEAVNPVPSVPVRCIQVDSPSHLFLAGEAMVPTHNTEILNNFTGFRIDQEPGPMLMLQPTLEMAKAWSKDRLATMIRDTPRLRGKVADARSRDADNTMLHKSFPGGHITVVGANSPAGLASRPIRDLIQDEIDRYSATAGGEGDPSAIAESRTATFPNAKNIKVSSPTLKGSPIDRAFEGSDQRWYWVPCPHCGHEQKLEFGGADTPYGLKWDAGKPETAHYVCVACSCIIEEHDKLLMLKKGRWIAENAESKIRGYCLSALYSPFFRWSRLVERWLRDKGDPLKLQTFVNTILCESWEETGEGVTAHILADRIWKDWPLNGDVRFVPRGAAVLTRSVDVQGDRLETAVWAWGEGEEAWLQDWELIPGDPASPGPWKELEHRIAKTYAHESGGALACSATFVDSGGHHTKQAYEFARGKSARRVYAIKGSSLQEGVPILSKPNRNDSARIVTYSVGSFTGKEILIKRLSRISEFGPGYVHLPPDIDSQHLDQYTNEVMETRFVRGRPVRVWVRKGPNEQIDLYVYALAALHSLGPAVFRRLGAIAKERADRAGKIVPPPPSEPAFPPLVQERLKGRRKNYANWKD